ncbi:transcriptional regulator (plasmid) [Haloferax mediterranei ATCC 33500]|uniref:Transcription regulator n=1 Tax=Haloferax mediterranei (strain ATCC 33500 / DSM 1411 / JCM 8866 / NBRC 14739 / NCIMB 2177 / R-4) TaxID=523841 RepID=I3RB90_HALMT|nr:helix-turn-helix domain-containing protein [Haloferax mediterranei]AFK21500.1 transcription regulator [Haloferax mediterranei ATCC 33500]ELZ97187.1 transcriptional regulator [Haloferax mediterranei ATCC 33500]MDX5990074.1 helix-turn-helix domain-containing protein [Haloferax mediterranei ATCC 33500]QCQ76840.1 transcriptional regulator [Haloferax mediterranei ATCC 33500]
MIEECLVAEFRIDGDDCPLARATEEVPATVDAAAPQLRADGNVLLHFSASSDDRLAATLDADDDIRYLHVTRGDDAHTYRCLSKHPCVVHELVDVGFLVESMEYNDGGATMRGAVVGYDVLRGVMEKAGHTVGIQLQRVYPLRSDETPPVGRAWDLTPAQEESLRVAVEMGYFELPRTITAEDVADELGISKSAFLERLRRAQQSLFGTLFG